jgi:hypothetical protein
VRTNAGGGFVQIYKHDTPRGVKPVKCFKMNVVETKRRGETAFARSGTLLGKGELPTWGSVYHLAGACLFALHPF